MVLEIRKQRPPDFPPKWASAYGMTRAGSYWIAFTLREVSTAFRWIHPGTFLMGSPRDEPDRHSDEVVHKVTLSQGYWLAETACTQALWQTVMGANPSRFKGDQLPVETVSWNDCEAFLERINALKPELALRLPTEAEWEYACRAGSTTRFSFGDTITTDQVNYDGTYPPEGSSRGEYRKRTVEVKAMPPNAWGLCGMHGNVEEWCQDWYGPYPNVEVVDPTGAETGEDRVVRGGSWDYGGGHVRSAYRSHWGPGHRGLDGGFRVARG